MYLPWDPSLKPIYDPRYYTVKKCKDDTILGKQNDLVIVDLINKVTDE